ncbi:hypothetical protein SteCoe_16393 [Stentor coeruleus]|uniref:Uncharacterized protein n=1 Tax=Stentor coeruleus TaxID=5963 RepID=A0A1R2C1D6_9CILI|nr:hypothetical protein SteCoe_16393 [Stentor coeruleus]
MTEENLIKFLSEESDKISNEALQSIPDFSIDLCSWGEIKPDSTNKLPNTEIPKFRIRAVGSRVQQKSKRLILKLHKGCSSNGSRSTSPNSEMSPNMKKDSCEKEHFRKRLASFNTYRNEELPIDYQDTQSVVNAIRVHKSPNPRRSRKPIKVFRLPRVEQGEEE